MSVFESITIGEGWISEHFFTSSGSGSFETKVKDRLKEWEEQEATDYGSPRSRFTKARRELSAELAALEEDSETGSSDSNTNAQELLLGVLGYVDGHGLKIVREGSLVKASAPGVEAQVPLAVILANPADTADDLLAKDEPTLAAPVKLEEDGDEFSSAARLLSALFTDDEAPAFALVLAGRIALLVEKGRWAEGRYLSVNLQLVAERNDTKKGGEIDTALTCLESRSLIPDAEGGIWWERTLADSVKHTVGVSKDLRDGVRLSIELLAQEVVDRRKDKGLGPLPRDQAQVLARQALRFLYRILFLLYAEASPELEVLPVGAPEYDQGYSLDRLRELVQVKLATPQAKAGAHLCESLALLFRLVDQGHAAKGENDLAFNSLRADLFKPEATALIDEVGLGNEALQRVLAHLLLSKEQRGKDRGFISYAELGINQLGAVYEGLMSYTGFFAEADLYEVAKDGDNSKGSWVVSADRIDGISESDFVRRADPITGELKPVLHPRGSFVFRLAGRERQQSASYYTPEVLTRFTVRQALEELLDQDGPTPAADILNLTVCEPALGSGAFAIEATRQLAERYLRRRQDELGERIDPDAYSHELQKAKAYIALHNVYGVDLNATAVELAEISLWLDTMVSGLAAPWFGLHLKRGNSLIGARRAAYTPQQVENKSWLNTPARDMPLTSLAQDIEDGLVGSAIGDGIHHFLLPAGGWGAAADAAEAKKLSPDKAKDLKTWRASMRKKPSARQIKALQGLSRRVETLWQFALQRLRLAEAQSRRAIDVWGTERLPAGGAIQREQIEASLSDANAAFARLRRAMDAWCALWFWPLTESLLIVDGTRISPPTLDEWIAGLQAILGTWRETRGRGKKWDQPESFASAAAWDELGLAEDFDRIDGSLLAITQAKAEHAWLEVAERIAAQQGFFHWELDIATVFAHGGFDLQVGNPPWVRPDSDVHALLAEGDPWWQLAVNPVQADIAMKREATLARPGLKDLVIDGLTDIGGLGAFMAALTEYPSLTGLRPDTYRCFMEQVWRHGAATGASALVHPETHFTDEKAGPLRQATYRRLRRHWQFINEKKLFEEVHNLVTFGVHVYGQEQEPSFLTAASLYHPDTVDRSFSHDGSGEAPGLKDPDGNWDLRPHKSRIIHVDLSTLDTWHLIIEEGIGAAGQTRMVYAVNADSENVMKKLAQGQRVGNLRLRYSSGWNETTDRRDGRFEIQWAVPETWADVILKAPQIHVANPLYQIPQATMANNRDTILVDLEAIPGAYLPATSYQPTGDQGAYDANYTDWGEGGTHDSARDHYRIAWREFVGSSTGERTLICALICPGTGHVHAIASSDGVDMQHLPQIAGFASSLLADFLVRSVPKKHVSFGAFARIPFVPNHPLLGLLCHRILRLNCLTDAYSDLWAAGWQNEFEKDTWSGGRERLNRPALATESSVWDWPTPIRAAEDRRQALVEIDALASVMLDVTADELVTVYRTQFPVLYGYDQRRHYDLNGRLVPNEVIKVWKTKGEAITEEERTATNQAGNTYTYQLPFVTLDREADMRQAHAHFTRLLEERS